MVRLEHRYAFEQILRSDRVGVWLVVFTALLMLLPRILAGVQDGLIHTTSVVRDEATGVVVTISP